MTAQYDEDDWQNLVDSNRTKWVESERVDEAHITFLQSRRIDIGPFLDGTFTVEYPSVGAFREDGVQMLYPARWHTVIAMTTAGKSWLGLLHTYTVLRAGGYVAYLHFEEAHPMGTLQRLLQLGIPADVLRERFLWFDCSTRWDRLQFTGELAQLTQAGTVPTLVILDGINSACTTHGWPVEKPEAVGAYRQWFVTPATRTGAAVLSLGHPPKSTDRQNERHGYGASGWLDEVDGAAYRMKASSGNPIGRGRKGWTEIYCVKDRYGEIERHCEVAANSDTGWFSFASMMIDSREDTIRFALEAPMAALKTGPKVSADKIGNLATAVTEFLGSVTDGRFQSTKWLNTALRAKGLKFTADDLAPALMRLASEGVIEWPETGERMARPGWLVRPALPGSPDLGGRDLDQWPQLP